MTELNLETFYNQMVGVCLIYFLEKQGFSRQNFQDFIGVSQPQVTRILKGQSALSIARLMRILDFMKITPRRFFYRMERVHLKQKFEVSA